MRLSVGRILEALSAVALVAGAAAAEEPIDLGSLPGYAFGRAKGIDERGDVVGQVARVGAEPVELAVLWHRQRPGQYVIEALPPLPGFDRSDARDFASGRVPIGFSYIPVPGAARFRAVYWRRDSSGLRVPVDLEPPAGFTDARAFAASLRGEVVGEALNPSEVTNGVALRHAVSWRLAWGRLETCDLGVPEGFDTSTAFDVNEAGDIVGTANRTESDGAGGLRMRSEVVVWRRPHRHSSACEAELLVLGGRDDLPFKQNPSINARGDVVARADLITNGQPTISRPLAWARRGRSYRPPFELPVPGGFTDAYARDLNSHGVVVGTALVRDAANRTTSAQGVLWRFERGRWEVTLLEQPAGVGFTSPEQISEKGDVVGTTPTPATGHSGALLWPHVKRHGHHDEDGSDDDRDD